jgi:two-component system, OmpR family, response regulator
MVPVSLQPLVVAYSARTSSSLAIDLSDLAPISVRWLHDVPALLAEVGLAGPVAVVVAGNEDNIAAMRVCYSVRQVTEAPVHLISSTMSPSEITLAHSLGATTVNTPLVAPAVITQLVRQFLQLTVKAGSEIPTRQLKFAGLELDLGRRQLAIRGNLVKLTKTEFQLLSVLASSTGSVVSREELVANVWGQNWFGVENVLDTHLAHLRRKLGEHGFQHAIVNVRGVGFYFDPKEKSGH